MRTRISMIADFFMSGATFVLGFALFFRIFIKESGNLIDKISVLPSLHITKLYLPAIVLAIYFFLDMLLCARLQNKYKSNPERWQKNLWHGLSEEVEKYILALSVYEFLNLSFESGYVFATIVWILCHVDTGKTPSKDANLYIGSVSVYGVVMLIVIQQWGLLAAIVTHATSDIAIDLLSSK